MGYITKINKAGDSFLIARPEKALIDYVNMKAKNLTIKTDVESAFLKANIRIHLLRIEAGKKFADKIQDNK